MNNKTNNNNNNNNTGNNNNSTENNNNNNNNINDISEPSSPTRSRRERELEQHRQRQHILIMKSNKMFKRCCCYMLILSLAMLLPAFNATTATETLLVTTDAPPPKRLATTTTTITTAAEILQLPRFFRHEEHYSHRIEKAVNDFKRAQLQQSKERDKNLTTKAPFTQIDNVNENDNSYNKNENNSTRLWQLEPHHRRHEQHHLQQTEQRQHLYLPDHHLRHNNGQHTKWEERVLPPMRHQRHQMKQQKFVVPIAPSTGLVQNKSSGNQRLTFDLKSDTFGDDFDESSEYDDDDDDNDDDDSSDDDSYESDSEESIHLNSFPRSSNSYSSIDGKAASVKRYTNPFKNYKTSATGASTKKRWNFFDEQKIERQRDIGTDVDDNNDDDSENDNGDSDNFTNEKWHKIQEEHYKRQQQHQHEIQALRLRHNPIATNQISTHEHHSKNEEMLDVNNVFSNNYIPGSLTLQKIEELGTAEAVQESRRTHSLKRKENRDFANAHVKQISNEATCRMPQRRIERIQLHPSKTYMPHCTILHRCGDDTGCCRSERETCAPKRWKNVDLYFWVKDIDMNKPTIERLTFVNHTECHCIERSQQRPDEYHDSNLMASNNGNSYIALRRATILNCNCPKFFEKILQEDGFCRCDCSSGNTDCNWLKRGMEHFSVIDRKCMLEGRCKPPTCEYGSYLRKHGRCPRHKEQLAYALSGSTNNLPLTKSFH